MELKEFITETLSQIIDGVSEVQEKYRDKNVLICPDDIQGANGDYHIEDSRCYEYYTRKTKVQFIDMDIAITVTEKDGNKSGIGIAKFINAGISSENIQQNESVSKINFSIPIVLPSSDVDEYFEKKEN
jgi:hypothetical protein